MKRNLRNLADQEWDLVVVGGGIHGATLAWEAVTRGLKTALIEKADFCQATSANSLRIIHGGLRYLQQADLPRIRQSVLARRHLMQFAPHLIHPQPFLIPTYGHGLKGREALTLALGLNDVLSFDRNRHLPSSHFLPRGRVVSPAECRRVLPDIRREGLTGGAIWYDGLVRHPERLTLEFLLSASEKGAEVANYVHALGFLTEKESVRGLMAKDLLTGAEFPVRARSVANACGPWLASLIPPGRPTPRMPLSWVKGINLVINKPLFSEYGVGLEERGPTSPKGGARFFFFVPWQGQTMVGTAYHRQEGNPGTCSLAAEELEGFLKEIQVLHPATRLTESDVSSFHVGLLPLSEGQDSRDDHPDPDRHFALYDHGSLGGWKGLLSIKSTKFTTAPVVARKAIDLISARSGSPVRPSRQERNPGDTAELDLEGDLRGASLPDEAGPPSALARHFWSNYGKRGKDLIRFARLDPASFQSVSARPLVTRAEVIHGIKEEMAVKLSDIVFRRTNLAHRGWPGAESVREVARIMASELLWDRAREQEEIAEVVQAYHPLRVQS